MKPHEMTMMLEEIRKLGASISGDAKSAWQAEADTRISRTQAGQAAAASESCARMIAETMVINRALREDIHDLMGDVQRLRRELLQDKREKDGQWIRMPSALVKMASAYEMTPEQYLAGMVETYVPQEKR